MECLGPALFEKDASGRPLARIGTLFLRSKGLVTKGNVHALQRILWLEHLNANRQTSGQPALTSAEEEQEVEQAVDLIFTASEVLIRPVPTPEGMAMAFEADQLLQEKVSKRRIRFLNIRNQVVRNALRTRGEAWRMAPAPLTDESMRTMVSTSRTSIQLEPIYYYNPHTGTRFLTCAMFSSLASLPEERLRAQLIEIRDYLGKRNRFGQPEVACFPTDAPFGAPALFASQVFENFTDGELRCCLSDLVKRWQECIPQALAEDNPDNPEWLAALCKALSAALNETVADDLAQGMGLSPEFFLRVKWLPGGRIEQGELVLDELFRESMLFPDDAELKELCDQTARGVLFNHAREFFDLEYINIGLVSAPLNSARTLDARSRVYILELKEHHSELPVARIIRVQKWNIASYLDDGLDLLQAIMRSEEYTDYIMDRRMGCRQIGMNLPTQQIAARAREWYRGKNARYRNSYIWTAYFERDYIPGRATNKLPAKACADGLYADKLARLLGEAAAANILLGRTRANGEVLFDDGDEVVMFDGLGLPGAIVLSDPVGAFSNYSGALAAMLPAYTRPLERRLGELGDAARFSRIYAQAFRLRLKAIQASVGGRWRALSTLFKDRPYDKAGSYAYRWECVLNRIRDTDMDALADDLEGRLSRVLA
ncbi:MAG: hypothetical protein SPK06_08305 [Kiritimatiellia bacterium]|nr:hypothetical protein [Kiritimatiellia bacterium]